MPIPYRSFLSSTPFQLIGPNGTIFLVHSDLLAQHSKRFDRAFNGGMREAVSGIIKIEEDNGNIDDGTILRFVEYAYTGDYTVPTPDEALKELLHSGQDKEQDRVSHEDATKSTTEDNMIDVVSGSLNTTSEHSLAPSTAPGTALPAGPSSGFPRSTKVELEAELQATTSAESLRSCEEDEWVGESLGGVTQSPTHAPHNQQKCTYCGRYSQFTNLQCTLNRKDVLWSTFVASAARQTSNNRDLHDDEYGAALMCHARLYVFSNQYECGQLAKLSLAKLAWTLSKCDATIHLEPVVMLVKYTYTHTYNYEKGCDRLRRLVVEYLVCHLEKFMASSSFTPLIREIEALAADSLTRGMVRLT